MSRRRGMPSGMTMIELIVALAIVAMALVLGALAFGGVSGAETRQGASAVATAIRYTYNLSAINNKSYALFLDLDANTYKAGPIEVTSECDRLLLNMDGEDAGPLVKTYGETKSEEAERRDDDEEEGGDFSAVIGLMGSEDTGPPAWTQNDGSPAGKLVRMLDGMTGERTATDGDTSEAARLATQKRLKTVRVNQLAEPQKLPEGVRFSGVVLREGGDPVTGGVVPILFYPHGYTQRALIYVSSGDEDADTFTVEVMTLQGTGRIHPEALDSGAFREEVDR